MQKKRSQASLPREKKLTREILNEHFHSNVHFEQSWSDKFADFLTQKFGTVLFLLFNLILFVAWLSYNGGLTGAEPFDPYPFNFLTMTVSLEAIFLSIIVLISQNKQSRIADIRQQMDFEINVRSEEEITKILEVIDDVRRASGITKRDPELELMKQRLDLEKLQKAAEQN